MSDRKSWTEIKSARAQRREERDTQKPETLSSWVHDFVPNGSASGLPKRSWRSGWGPPSRRWPVSRPGESLQAWTPCTALPRPSAWSWSSTFVSGHLPDEQRRRDEIGT